MEAERKAVESDEAVFLCGSKWWTNKTKFKEKLVKKSHLYETRENSYVLTVSPLYYWISMLINRDPLKPLN